MNPGQEKFRNYILERVCDSRMAEAEELLRESFQKQDERTFDLAYLHDFMPRMRALLKPEYVEEVNQIMNEFAGKWAR